MYLNYSIIKQFLIKAFTLITVSSLTCTAIIHAQCCADGPNLLANYNPDFSDPIPPGGTPPGFICSNTFFNNQSGGGRYLIAISRSWGACSSNPQYDHTKGDATGKFLWFDTPGWASSFNPAVAWQPYDPNKPAGTQNLIDVTPKTDYVFGVWIRDIGRNADCVSGGAPVMGLRINGVDLAEIDLGKFTSPCCPEWVYLCCPWNSGRNTTAQIQVESRSAQGYTDLAIDDVYFGTSSSFYAKVMLGNDTAICQGDSLTLGSQQNINNATYHWSTGDTTPYITVTSSGLYKLTVKANGCEGTDSINITFDNPDVQLGADTSICEGDSIKLSSSATYQSPDYLWSTGARTPAITVHQGGIYTLEVTDGKCTGKDSINIEAIDIKVDLGEDTTICNGDSYTLKPKNTAYTNPAYQWSNGETSPSITISQSGLYKLMVRDRGCVGSDSIHLIFAPTLPISLGDDTVLCKKEAVMLSPMPQLTDVSYKWSTGSTNATLWVETTGGYWLQITDKYGCTNADTIQITYVNLKQNLGGDRLLCEEEPINIPLNGNVPTGATALWSSGATAPSIEAHDTGQYWINVNFPPCEGSDTITISLRRCDCQVNVPNAFSPNGDGLNDLFQPVMDINCPIRGYRFSIYNRYGQLVFYSAKAEEGWDGNMRGEQAEMGVYMYVLNYTINLTSERKTIKGDVTLLR